MVTFLIRTSILGAALTLIWVSMVQRLLVRGAYWRHEMCYKKYGIDSPNVLFYLKTLKQILSSRNSQLKKVNSEILDKVLSKIWHRNRKSHISWFLRYSIFFSIFQRLDIGIVSKNQDRLTCKATGLFL